jgi:hypothetical protein
MTGANCWTNHNDVGVRHLLNFEMHADCYMGEEHGRGLQETGAYATDHEYHDTVYYYE